MPLIKSSNVPATAAVFSMADIEAHARDILRRAREKAEAIVAQTQLECQSLTESARREGFEEGRREGLSAGKSEGIELGRKEAIAQHHERLEKLCTTLQALVRELEQSRLRLNSSAAEHLTRVALATAGKLARRAGAIDPEVLKAQLTNAATLVTHAEDVRLAVHPSQRAILLEMLPEVGRDWPSLQHVELVEDASISPGGCRIYTRQGLVDAELDAQISQIAAELIPTEESLAPLGEVRK
jgi:flagellar assembly protein FliH